MTAPLRWLVMADHVPANGSLGGIVRYTMELIAALSRRDDIEVSATAAPDARDAVAAAVGDPRHVHVMPALPAELYPVVNRLRLPPGAVGVDVIQGVKHLLPRRSTALRVLTIHDMLLLDRPGDFGTAKRIGLPPAYRRSIRDADLLACVSSATRRRLVHHSPDSAGRAAVVPLAASPTLLSGRAEPLEALAGQTFALVVGDSSRRKNLATVVSAWREVRAALPDAVLAIAGPPDWTRAELGHEYAALRDSGAIAALGHVTDAQLRWAYEHAALVLCPSLVEGFGLPVAEALELGAPVAISDDAALVEAAAGRAASVVAARDVDGWAAAAVRGLLDPAGDRSPAPHPRSWDDVAAETVAAVTHARPTRLAAH